MTARESRAVYLTLEPDGWAAACKAVEVGSIPTGVSQKSIERVNQSTRSTVNLDN